MAEYRELSDFERLRSTIKWIQKYPGQKRPEEIKYNIFEDKFAMEKLGKGDAEQGKKRMKQLLKRDCYLLKEFY